VRYGRIDDVNLDAVVYPNGIDELPYNIPGPYADEPAGDRRRNAQRPVPRRRAARRQEPDPSIRPRFLRLANNPRAQEVIQILNHDPRVLYLRDQELEAEQMVGPDDDYLSQLMVDGVPEEQERDLIALYELIKPLL
jgi:hypothetical protein